MSKQLAKNVRIANLVAVAAEEAAHEHEHRAKFEKLINQIKSALDGGMDPEIIHRLRLDFDFSDAVRIAKRHLRMKKEEFEAAVAVLNTPISRVVDRCPSGKDTRDVPDWMRMTAEELRLSYDLMTHYDATDFIVLRGAMWGYTASEIAVAKKEHRPLEAARLAKRHAGDMERQATESARIAARASAGHTATLYSADGTSQPYL